MLKKYVKGDREKVVTRIDQVSDITVCVPSTQKCMDYLYDSLMILCNNYVDRDDVDTFLHIPYIDFYNVVLFANKCCKEKEVDMEYISAMMSIIRSFVNLKYISIVFKDDDELRDSYERLINMDSDDTADDVINELANVYSIDVLEFYMSDMFDQDIIDIINKNFIVNEIISNSYLEREFMITFKFDEYISYINMFIENNIDFVLF